MTDCRSHPVFRRRQVDREGRDVSGSENVGDVRLQELVDEDVAAGIEFDVWIGLENENKSNLLPYFLK